MANEVLRAEHDAVLSSLSSRDSTRQFAHGAISMILAVILFGTAAKLWWDFALENPEWWMTSAALGAVVLSYSTFRLLMGTRLYGRERVQYVRLLELRRSLGLDAVTPTAS